MDESTGPYQSGKTSFREVYLNNYDNVYTCAFFYLKQHERAEDITQSIFLHLWENWEKLSIQSIQNYLFVTTKNTVFNEIRKLSVQEKYKTFLRERFEEQTGNIEEQSILRQQAELLDKAVRRLPQRQQLAWRLSRDKGMTYQEVATEMGISRPTVKELISKSIQSIKTFLQSFNLLFFLF